MSGLILIQLLDTLIIFLKEFIEKVDFEKNQKMTKHEEISQWAKSYCESCVYQLISFSFLGAEY